MPSQKSQRRVLERLLFVTVFVGYSYFYGGDNVSQLARTLPIFAFIEAESPARGTFAIDHFLATARTYTCDLSQFAGKTFSNKAPGPILLGLLPYALLYWVERAAGLAPAGYPLRSVNSYLLNVLLTCLPAAFAAVAFFRLLILRRTGRGRAVLLTAALFFATFAWPYGTQLWGHVTAMSFLTCALVFLALPDRNTTARHLLWSGLLTGLAAVTDYLTVLGLPLILWRAAMLKRAGSLGAACAGLLVPILLHMWYAWLSFGSPWVISTTYTLPEFTNPTHTLGLFGRPSLAVLFFLLVSPNRGILIAMPILFVAAVGLLAEFRRKPLRFWNSAPIGVALALLLVNSAFSGWSSGWSAGVRYQIIALPFWMLGLRHTPRTGLGTVTAILLGFVSFFQMIALVAVSPFVPADIPEPLYDFALPLFTAGQFAQPGLSEILELQAQGPFGGKAAGGFQQFLIDTPTNLGALLGLTSWWSLIPLVFVIGGMWWIVLRKTAAAPRSLLALMGLGNRQNRSFPQR